MEERPAMGMQIADVFVPELNKIDPDISLDNLAALLDPFLTTVATSNNRLCSPEQQTEYS